LVDWKAARTVAQTVGARAGQKAWCMVAQLVFQLVDERAGQKAAQSVEELAGN
jgi:hypothetical protein